MSNKKEIIKLIKEKIQQNTPKLQIESELSSKYQPTEYQKILNDFPEPALREKYKLYTNIIVFCFSISLLVKEVPTIVGIFLSWGEPTIISGFTLLIARLLIIILIGLAILISIAIIFYLLQGHRIGYSAIIILVGLSFLGTLNNIPKALEKGPIDIIFVFAYLLVEGVAVLLSFILLKKLFPKQLANTL